MRRFFLMTRVILTSMLVGVWLFGILSVQRAAVSFFSLGAMSTSVGSALFGGILPALLWTAVSYPAFRTLLQNGPAEPLELLRRGLSAVFATLVIALFLLRHPRRGERASIMPSLIAYLGTFSLLLLAGAPLLHRDPLLLAVSGAVCIAGLAWSLLSLATLGRYFGIRPVARGLVTHGPYRVVRHQLYLGELVFALGLVLPILSHLTALIWLLAAGLQLRRAINEEQVLSAAFPTYHDYRARTSFMIPLVW